MTLFQGLASVMNIIYLKLYSISFFGVSIIALIFGMVIAGLLISVITRLEK